MVDILGGFPIKWKLFFRNLGWPAALQQSQGLEIKNILSMGVILSLYFVCFCFAFAWLGGFLFCFVLFFYENKSHWHGLHKHGLNQKDLPLD